MSEEKIKKKYSLFEKKYSLPSFETLEKDFDLHELSQKHILKKIREKLSEKIDEVKDILSGIFDGEANISNIYEIKVLDDSKKEEIFKIYKKLMKYSRQSNILSLSYEEEEEAKFIKEFYHEWEHLKEKIKKHLMMLKKSWEKDSDINNSILNYLG